MIMSKVKNSIENVPPGIYWAYYKDHGWRLIYVMEKLSYPRQVKEIDDYFSDGYLIPRTDWFKYQNLKKIKEPEYGD